jgi:hypothetical protein
VFSRWNRREWRRTGEKKFKGPAREEIKNKNRKNPNQLTGNLNFAKFLPTKTFPANVLEKGREKEDRSYYLVLSFLPPK